MKLYYYGLALGAMLLASPAVRAQEYKIPVDNIKDGQLFLQNFNGELPVEGYNGNEIVFTAENLGETPERAKGLKAVYPGGTDNSGIGLQVDKGEGGHIKVSCILPFNRDVHYKVKVPAGLRLKIERGCERSDKVIVSGMTSEVDINNCQGIELTNVTGPLVLSSISGDIKVAFTTVSKDKPISIATISGEVDVTLPANTPANLEMSAISGGMYTDFDLSKDSKDMKKVGGGEINTTINGGGVDIKLTTVSGNIYLRKS